MRRSLRARLTVYFVALVFVPLILVGAIGTWQSYNTQVPQALDAQSQVAKRVAEQVKNFIRERENELRSLEDVRGLSSATREEQTKLLSWLFSTHSVYEELTLVNGRGKELVHLSHVDIITAQNLGSRAGASEFETPKETGETYFSAVTFNESTGEPFMIISIPLFNLQTGELANVLIANFRFKEVWNIMAQADVIGSGIVYMIDHDAQVIAHANPSVVLQGTSVNLPEENAFTTGLSGDNVAMAREHIQFGEQDFDVVAEQPGSEALSSALNNIYLTAGITLAAMVLAGFLGVLAAGQITNPIGELAQTAQLISEGDLTQKPVVKSQDEIGALATAFGDMTTRLQQILGTLEQRVAARTRALATSSEVSRRLSTILNRRELVIEVVEQVKEAFGYYHAHIYLYNEERDELVMAGGTGDAGAAMLAEGHKIPKGRGLVGRAAESNEAVLVPDTTQDPDWLPNPMLPETKSEAAIPISIGGQVLGVLDVQHDVTDGLGQDDVDSLQSIANQVAVAMQNINQYESTQKMAADLEVVSNVGIATSTITDAEHLLREVVDLSKQSFGLYHAHIYLLDETEGTLRLASGAGEVGRKMVADGHTISLDSEKSLVARAARTREGVVSNDVQADPDFLSNPLLPRTRAEMAVPMLVSGKVIGVLDVQSEQVDRFTDIDISIQTTLASQIAVALQNARSFASAQKQVDRESRLNVIAQKIQNTSTIEEAMQVAARELGHAVGKRQTLVALDPAALAGDGKKVVAE